jgi:Fur family peroxide stress response transcriptional regulator
MEKTMKRSRQREAMLKLIKSTKSHPDAAWLYEKMKEKFPNISLGTVYRNLGVLTQTGDIVRVCTSDGTERYDGDTSSHSHFICRVCRGVSDIDIPDTGELDALAEKSGVSVESHSLIFCGVCKECRNKNNI